MPFQISLIGILVAICVGLQRLCPGQARFLHSVADLSLHSTLAKDSQGQAQFLGTSCDLTLLSVVAGKSVRMQLSNVVIEPTFNTF